MALPKNVVTVFQGYRARFENELRRCRTLGQIRKLGKKWTRENSGVIDAALRSYRPLQNLENAFPGSKSVFKRHMTKHVGNAIDELNILYR
jgi:hypothetical protein